MTSIFEPLKKKLKDLLSLYKTIWALKIIVIEEKIIGSSIFNLLICPLVAKASFGHTFRQAITPSMLNKYEKLS